MAIFRFHRDLANTNFKTRFEGKDDKGKITMIRLVEGTESVYEKQQDENARQKTFKTGYPNVQVGNEAYYQTEITDPATINFLKHSPYYGGKIVEFDPQKENSEKLAAKKQTLNLLKTVAAYDREQIIEVGYVMLGKRAMEYIRQDDIDGLHNELLDLASEKPDELSDKTENKSNGDMLVAAALIGNGILEVTADERFVRWADNESVAYTVPNGVAPLEGLVDYFQTKEGREVKKEAAAKLEMKAKATVTKRATAAKKDTEEK